ncbi:MAG: hypothetical protein JXA20_17555 [Spirochaetes bacterium]|nr:hypothetical protein [Spirochaetota bacterium]
MRALLVITASLMAAAMITLTACEAVFDRYLTDSDSVIYLFRSSKSYNGTMGGQGTRDGLDAICIGEYQAKYGHLPVENVRAFINVSPDDQMPYMPALFGVPTDRPIQAVSANSPYAPTLILAYDWNDLMDGRLLATLIAADVAESSTSYWLGDKSDGTAIGDASSTCQYWTSNVGVGGMVTSGETVWLGFGNASCANNSRILCIAW